MESIKRVNVEGKKVIVRVDFISSGNSYRCSGSELLKKLKIENIF